MSTKCRYSSETCIVLYLESVTNLPNFTHHLLPLGPLIATFLCIFTVTHIHLWTPSVLTVYLPTSEAGLCSSLIPPLKQTWCYKEYVM